MSLFLILSHFEYGMLWLSVFMFLGWGSLTFLNLLVYFCQQIWQISAVILPIFFFLTTLSSPLGTPITCILDCSLMLCSFLENSFYPLCSIFDNLSYCVFKYLSHVVSNVLFTYIQCMFHLRHCTFYF